MEMASPRAPSTSWRACCCLPCACTSHEFTVLVACAKHALQGVLGALDAFDAHAHQWAPDAFDVYVLCLTHLMPLMYMSLILYYAACTQCLCSTLAKSHLGGSIVLKYVKADYVIWRCAAQTCDSLFDWSVGRKVCGSMEMAAQNMHLWYL